MFASRLRPFPPKLIPTKMLTFQPPSLSVYSSNNSFSLTMSSSSFTISSRTSKSSSKNSDTQQNTRYFLWLGEEWNETGPGRDPFVPTKFSNLGPEIFVELIAPQDSGFHEQKFPYLRRLFETTCKDWEIPHHCISRFYKYHGYS